MNVERNFITCIKEVSNLFNNSDIWPSKADGKKEEKIFKQIT